MFTVEAGCRLNRKKLRFAHFYRHQLNAIICNLRQMGLRQTSKYSSPKSPLRFVRSLSDEFLSTQVLLRQSQSEFGRWFRSSRGSKLKLLLRRNSRSFRLVRTHPHNPLYSLIRTRQSHAVQHKNSSCFQLFPAPLWSNSKIYWNFPNA